MESRRQIEKTDSDRGSGEAVGFSGISMAMRAARRSEWKQNFRVSISRRKTAERVARLIALARRILWNS